MWAKMKVMKRKACPGDASAPLPPEGRLLGERPERVLRQRAWKRGLGGLGALSAALQSLAFAG